LRILSSHDLKIKSEDWLFGLFRSPVDRDSFSLVEFVQFEFVQVAVMRRVAPGSPEFCDFLNSSV
jgi:hypothetical protein